MADVKVTQLRQNLPGYLARVRRGERLRITSRGKVVAELGPPSPSEAEARKARAALKGSVLRWDNPLEPAFDPSEWDVNK